MESATAVLVSGLSMYMHTGIVYRYYACGVQNIKKYFYTIYAFNLRCDSQCSNTIQYNTPMCKLGVCT